MSKSIPSLEIIEEFLSVRRPDRVDHKGQQIFPRLQAAAFRDDGFTCHHNVIRLRKSGSNPTNRRRGRSGLQNRDDNLHLRTVIPRRQARLTSCGHTGSLQINTDRRIPDRHTARDVLPVDDAVLVWTHWGESMGDRSRLTIVQGERCNCRQLKPHL